MDVSNSLFAKIDAIIQSIDDGDIAAFLAQRCSRDLDLQVPVPGKVSVEYPHVDIVHKGDGNCCICLESYQTAEKVHLLECHHKFHPHCIARWLLKQDNCPLCKHTIRVQR
jgi:hypothetical protein